MVRTILIVEDDRDIREMVAEVLEQEGYSVSIAPDGKSGLQRLSEQSDIGLILLDYQMPGMGGDDFLKHARSNPKLSHIPIVVITALKRSVTFPGSDGTLNKPFSLDELLSTVERHFLPRADLANLLAP